MLLNASVACSQYAGICCSEHFPLLPLNCNPFSFPSTPTTGVPSSSRRDEADDESAGGGSDLSSQAQRSLRVGVEGVPPGSWGIQTQSCRMPQQTAKGSSGFMGEGAEPCWSIWCCLTHAHTSCGCALQGLAWFVQLTQCVFRDVTYSVCNCWCLNCKRWCLERSLAFPEIFMYFIFKLQVKDQGKNEAGELYSKLEKVCYFCVLDFTSWVFHFMHRNQESLVSQWHAWPHSPHSLSFYVFRCLGVIHCSLIWYKAVSG